MIRRNFGVRKHELFWGPSSPKSYQKNVAVQFTCPPPKLVLNVFSMQMLFVTFGARYENIRNLRPPLRRWKPPDNEKIRGKQKKLLAVGEGWQGQGLEGQRK